MDKHKFAKLLKRIRAGDKKAMDVLYNALYHVIYAAERFYLKNREDAEDLTEETFLKIITYKGEPVEDPVVWIKRMIHNDCCNYFIRKSREIAAEDIDGQYSAPQNGAADDVAIFREELAQLDETEKAIVIDHVFWGYTLKAISAERGMTYITIKRRYAEIKEKIKNFLDS